MELAVAGDSLRAFAARFFRFGVVGATGFLVDIGVLLTLISQVGLDPYTARIVSIITAVTVTWRLNRAVTFQPSAHGQMREGARYFFVAAATALTNFTIYSTLLILIADLPPLLATAIATVITMFLSYFGYSQVVFKR